MARDLSNSEMISAINWAAGNAGISYGKFQIGLTAEEQEQIYTEYGRLLEIRQREEAERLRRAKEAKRLSKGRKKKKVF